MHGAPKTLAEADLAGIGRWLIAGAWYGLVGGHLEVAILALRRYGLGQIFLISPDFAWMVPASHVALLLTVALALGALGTAWPNLLAVEVTAAWVRRTRRLGLAVPRETLFLFVLGTCSAFSVLQAVPRLSDGARALLAMGVAFQAARLIVRNVARFERLALRSAPVIAGAVIAAGLGLHWRNDLEEKSVLARLPAPAQGARNVLVVVLDAVRARNLGLYGYSRPTSPNLDRLGRDGVVFDLAVAPSPWSLPSHASMFTGLYPEEHGADWRVPLDAAPPTIAEVLRDRGYRTAGFVSNLLYGSRIHGLARGFVHYEDFPVSLGQLAVSSALGKKLAAQESWRHWLDYHRVLNRKPAAQVAADFLEWLDESGDRPFFGFINFFDAHEPYLPPAELASRFGPPRRNARFAHTAFDAWRVGKPRMTEEQRAAELAAYDGTIAYMDRQLGVLVEGLRSRGVLENTILIVTADHGEQFGEHGLFSHGNSLYLVALRVPLVIHAPGLVPPGRRISEAVSLVQLPATILDLLDQAEPAIPGGSLAWYWSGAKPAADSLSYPHAEASRREIGAAPDWYPLSQGDMASVIAGTLHYIRHEDGREELFDLRSDFLEERNLMERQPAGLRVPLERLRKLVAAAPHGAPGGS